MQKKHVKDENYISIQGWMVTKLNLKANELMLFALIYGFSQTQDNCFSGSISYMGDWIDSARSTVIRVLKSLEEKELIIKRQREIQNVKLNEYVVNLEKVENIIISEKNKENEKVSKDASEKGGSKMLLGVAKCNNEKQKNNFSEKNTPILPKGGSSKMLLGVAKCYGGGSKMLPNNIYNNIDNNINIIYKEREKYIKRERVKNFRFVKKDSPLSPPVSVHELTEEEYNLLAKEFGRTLAMQKAFKAKKYTGCYTYDTIRKWCLEDLQKPPPKVKSRFNNFEGRDYDMDALTQKLIE